MAGWQRLGGVDMAAGSRFLPLCFMSLAILLAACSPPLPSSNSPPATGLIRKLSGHGLWVSSVSWSPDGKRLASGSQDGTVRMWEVGSGRTEATLFSSTGGGITAVAWSPDGRYLAAGAAARGEIVEVWDTTNWQRVFGDDPLIPNAPNLAEIDSISWSPDSKNLAVGLEGFTGTHTKPISWIQVYEVGEIGNWQNTSTLTYSNYLYSVAWSPDGKQIAFAAEPVPQAQPVDASIGIWEPSGREDTEENVTLLATRDAVTDLAWSPNGKSIGLAISGSRTEIVQVLDLASKQITSMISDHDNVILDIAWSPNGELLASGSMDTTVKVWDVASRQSIATFKHNDVVTSVAWSPDGKHLASGCANYNVYIREVKKVAQP